MTIMTAIGGVRLPSRAGRLPGRETGAPGPAPAGSDAELAGRTMLLTALAEQGNRDAPGVVLDLRGLLRQQAVARLNLRRRSPRHAGN
jgi:hypothetical protein